MSLAQTWFEMPEIRQRNFERAVWVPLRATHTISEAGEHGHIGYKTEFFGAGSLAIPLEKRESADELEWMDVGIFHSHCGYVQDGQYQAAHLYFHYGNEVIGEHLVLEQRGNSLEHNEWHLAQDFAITLGLKREGDTWVRPDEGYIEVVKLYRKKNGAPYLIEVKSSYLRDYLSARKMALLITSYRDRVEITESIESLTWVNPPLSDVNGEDRWEGRISAIHEGGLPFGATTAVFHASRTDIELEEDVPSLEFSNEGQIKTDSWTVEHEGKKLYRVEGELWRNEWIEPAPRSPIVRGDKSLPTVFFTTDANGSQESRETLIEGIRWLWFKPDVIPNIAHRRGGSLSWYTALTGSVCCSPDYGVHFGINRLGLVNIYAKDIGLLPDWQQKIWSGHNVAPDGKVSEELLDSQMRVKPANTQAPEAFIEPGLLQLSAVSRDKLGIDIMRAHEAVPEILRKCHRFRATDSAGLYSLAKDIARITADCIDASAIQTIVRSPKGTKWGSLKLLENLLAKQINSDVARNMLSSLVGVYELRHGDAHMPRSDIEDAFKLVGINSALPFVFQGQQMLHACVSSIFGIIDVLKAWNPE